MLAQQGATKVAQAYVPAVAGKFVGANGVASGAVPTRHAHAIHNHEDAQQLPRCVLVSGSPLFWAHL